MGTTQKKSLGFSARRPGIYMPAMAMPARARNPSAGSRLSDSAMPKASSVLSALSWIDRLLKNQNPLEKYNNLRSSSPYLVVGRRPEDRAAILRSEIQGHGSHGCSDRWCSVRAFDVSTARRSAAAVSRGSRPDGSRARWRLRQSHHLAPALSSTGGAQRCLEWPLSNYPGGHVDVGFWGMRTRSNRQR